RMMAWYEYLTSTIPEPQRLHGAASAGVIRRVTLAKSIELSAHRCPSRRATGSADTCGALYPAPTKLFTPLLGSASAWRVTAICSCSLPPGRSPVPALLYGAAVAPGATTPLCGI